MVYLERGRLARILEEQARAQFAIAGLYFRLTPEMPAMTVFFYGIVALSANERSVCVRRLRLTAMRAGKCTAFSGGDCRACEAMRGKGFSPTKRPRAPNACALSM
jgi:hypothetical protein